MVQEVWKPIPNFPLYEASDLGQIRSWNGRTRWGAKKREVPHVLSGTKGSHEYYMVHVFNDSGRHVFCVHRLILEAFIGACPPGMEACHGDGNRQNNRLDNLRWDTYKNNKQDTIRHKRFIGPVRRVYKGLSRDEIVEQVLEIRRLYASGEYTQTKLSNKFGVSQSTIWRIVHRKTWDHI